MKRFLSVARICSSVDAGVLSLVLFLVVVLMMSSARADVYIQSPRGSNNKLFEQSDNTQNQNRLFDSQNNAVGDNCKPHCHVSNEDRSYDETKEGSGEGVMYYYESSLLHIEWTAQHGCGSQNPSMNCELIFQYACEDTMPYLRDGRTLVKPGGNNNQDNVKENEKQQSFPDSTKMTETYGQHEPYEFYSRCRRRERNRGLYTSNRINTNPNGQNQKTAVYTRQRNNGGNSNNGRFGLECPEERDYYPYWHPTPWRDFLVMTDTTERCPLYIHESQNVVDKGECASDPPLFCEDSERCIKQTYDKNQGQYPYPNNPTSCRNLPDVDSNFKSASWQLKGSFRTNAPDCLKTQWSRLNHHGSGKNGWPTSYAWRIPSDPLDNPALPFLDDSTGCVKGKVGKVTLYEPDKGNRELHLEARSCTSILYLKGKIQEQWGYPRHTLTLESEDGKNLDAAGEGGPRNTLLEHGLEGNVRLKVRHNDERNLRCIIRMRYNTTSGDFDGWATFEGQNGGKFIGTTADPSKDWLGLGTGKSGPLKLNVNTAQFSRVFEDRSHVFEIKRRPAHVLVYSEIINLNVRGRRGNIVQVYPALEYDFVWGGMYTNDMSVSQFDLLHIQWTGSDANQAGNAGNGRDKTDRSNLVQIAHRDVNSPMSLLVNGDTLSTSDSDDEEGTKVVSQETRDLIDWEHVMFDDVATISKLAFLDQNVSGCDLNSNNEQSDDNCRFLNMAPAYFDAGLVEVRRTGTFHFMSTRNNAFTNRAQKATMHVRFNGLFAAFVSACAGTAIVLGIGIWKMSTSLPKHVAKYPDGCFAKTCCGRCAMSRYEASQTQRKQEKIRRASFLAEVDSERHLNIGNNNGGNEKEAADQQVKLTKFQEWWQYEGLRIKWILVIVACNVGIGLYGGLNAAASRP
eukprot:g1992.t1